MDGLTLLIDLHKDGSRQGPGNDTEIELYETFHAYLSYGFYIARRA